MPKRHPPFLYRLSLFHSPFVDELAVPQTAFGGEFAVPGLPDDVVGRTRLPDAS